MDRFPLAAVHEVNLPGLDGVGPGIDIVDAEGFHFVEVGAAFFPVVRVSPGDGGHTRLPFLKYVSTGTDPLFEFLAFGSILKHGYMVVGHDERKVGNAGVKFENHAMFAVGLDVLDRLEVSLGIGLGVFPPMVVH